MFMSDNSTLIYEYIYDDMPISVYRGLESLFFTTILDDCEHVLYEIKISDLKRNPFLDDVLKNKLLEHLKS